MLEADASKILDAMVLSKSSKVINKTITGRLINFFYSNVRMGTSALNTYAKDLLS